MKIFKFLFYLVVFSICTGSLACRTNQDIEDPRFILHTVDLKQQTLKFYLKNDKGINHGNYKNLKTYLENKNQELTFATNGGMYMKDGSPQGLYIENGITKASIDIQKEGYGNFYLKPNGIFYLTKDNKGVVCKTEEFKLDTNITYATQSGPMLVINNKIHPVFAQDSKHLHIRNGIGVLANGNFGVIIAETENLN